jgi:hypothetical protein
VYEGFGGGVTNGLTTGSSGSRPKAAETISVIGIVRQAISLVQPPQSTSGFPPGLGLPPAIFHRSAHSICQATRRSDRRSPARVT